ncbi:MAG TPA: DUF3124 domain-containing protein [Syntrophobacteraceae bacterium]|nr:DUF3124 domain-containing protein [Syntrophobacteraceae bacterium]
MRVSRIPRRLTTSAAFILLMTGLVSPGLASVKLVKGQTVYVPAYSHIYYGDRELPFYLTVTLSIRNTDPTHPITLVSVDYFDSDGKRLQSHLAKELKLNPMSSTRFVVKESDKSGGSGASFLVTWKSDKKVCEPVIETVMISTSTQQGISFSSRGKPVKELED